MKTHVNTKLFVTATLVSLLALPALSIDLSARYPTELKIGDAEPDHARPWEFTPEDIFRVTQFQLQVGDKFKVETQAADMGIGHCTNGAVWAVLLPRASGTLTSPQAAGGESIANIWLRFHPAQINQLFPAETVFEDGDKSLLAKIQGVVSAKFRTSWHAGMNAMIPEPKDLTVYVDTKSGEHRFFMVDTDAKTAEYVAAFNQKQSSAPDITPSSVPPVVVKTVPESGSTNVPPGEFEIKVTFSKAMMDRSWSWCSVWDDSTPEGAAPPKYDADGKTCVSKVQLDPGTTYGYWLNTGRFQNFRDTEGHSAIPYLLVFSTTGQAPSFLEKKLKQAEAGNYWAKFDLWDAYAHGKHDVDTNSTEASHWLGEVVKGTYLAKFEPVNGFAPRTPEEMLNEFNSHCGLQSGHDSLGGASFFRTTKQDGKLIGSFLTDSPDAFKAALEHDRNLKLISVDPLTPEQFTRYETSEQESL
jgi:RNA polymerase sigma-70 factor (ECF subfamily)